MTVKVQNKTFKTLAEASRFYGQSPANVSARKARGWTLQQALNIDSPPLKKRGKKTKILGKVFSSKRERNAYYNLSQSTEDLIEKRLKRGWTERQAVELDPPPPRFRNLDNSQRKGGWREREKIDGSNFPKAAYGEYKVYKLCKFKIIYRHNDQSP